MKENADLRQRLIECAKEMILSNADDEVSLDAIVAAAGAPSDSVATLIGTKEDLFALVVRDMTQSMIDKILSVSPDGLGAQEFLQTFAENYLRSICTRDALKILQFSAGMARRFPHVSAQFLIRLREGGEWLAQTLEKDVNIVLPEGQTYRDASSQFYALCRGAFHHQLIFDIDYIVSEQEITDQARKAVASFLRAFPVRD